MRSPSGFTLLEVALVAAILVAVLAASTGVVGTTGATLATGTSIAALEAKANRVLDQVSSELFQAGLTTLQPAAPTGSPSLGYRRGAGYADGDNLWGPQRRIELRPEEAVDGTDNDGDGYVDEHRVVWIEDPGLASERQVTWARGVRANLEGEAPNGVDDNGNGLVDEPGLCFQLQGDALTVRVSVEGRDPAGRFFTRTATTALRLRN
jgi:hypothetical protein